MARSKKRKCVDALHAFTQIRYALRLLQSDEVQASAGEIFYEEIIRIGEVISDLQETVYELETMSRRRESFNFNYGEADNGG